MAKQRLFPEHKKPKDETSREHFENVAIRVFSTPKSDIDKREDEWKRTKGPKRS